MGWSRDVGAPFRLTAIELRICEMKFAGMTTDQIKTALGWVVRGKSLGSVNITAAIEKYRLLQLHDKRERGTSSLATARGKTRMEGTK